MDAKYQKPIAPVPLEKHYEIFKSIEGKLKGYLDGLEQGYLLIGLRVAYDEKDSSNEPDVLPYVVESGYLELVDLILGCGEEEEIDYDEMVKRTLHSSMPITVLDEQFEFARKELESAASRELNVGVYVEVKSNPIGVRGVRCTCRSNPRQKKLSASNNTTVSTQTTCVAGC